MGKITINRKKEFIYEAMKFKIILDGNKIASLTPSEELNLELKNGSHELFIKGGLFATSNLVKFNLEDNKIKKFFAESFKNGFINKYIKLSQI